MLHSETEKVGSSQKKDNSQLVTDAINAIGVGKYQTSLFLLCGLGWAADNIFMQAISVIQPQVQLEFNLSNSQAAIILMFMQIGMMFGAIFWGAMSDMIGRRPSFISTLLISTLFAGTAGLSPNYPTLCTLVTFMGFGIGGMLTK